MCRLHFTGGRDCAVGVATRNGLDSPGIESRWGGEIFRIRPDWPWGPPSLLYNSYRVFPGVNRPGRGVDHPPPFSAEVTERIELYLYSPSGPLWPVIGWILPLPVHFTSIHYWYILNYVGWNSIVSIATCCELEVWGSNTGRSSRDFPHQCKLAVGPTQPCVRWVLALFPGSKVARVWR